MELPSDPFLLLSLINTKLRDEYGTLFELAAAEGVDEGEIIERLKAAGFEYCPEQNAFK